MTNLQKKFAKIIDEFGEIDIKLISSDDSDFTKFLKFYKDNGEYVVDGANKVLTLSDGTEYHSNTYRLCSLINFPDELIEKILKDLNK